MAAPSESPARIFAKVNSQPPPDLLAPPSPSLRFLRKSLVGRPSAFKPHRNFREGFANIPLERGVTTYRSSFLRPSFPAPPGFVRLCVFRECIRSPGFWPLGGDSGRTAALPKASTMTVSPDARICGGLARMGPVARYDDSCESSSRATARTATGGAPCFATSPIVSHSGRNRSPPTHPRRCAASNLTRGARTARRLTSPSVSLPAPSELALCAPRWLLPDSTIRRKFLNACPNSQQQPREIPSPGVVRARCAYGEPPPCSQGELRFRLSTNMFQGPYAESRVLVRGTQRPSN